jgi:hypothetical protein
MASPFLLRELKPAFELQSLASGPRAEQVHWNCIRPELSVRRTGSMPSFASVSTQLAPRSTEKSGPAGTVSRPTVPNHKPAHDIMGTHGESHSDCHEIGPDIHQFTRPHHKGHHNQVRHVSCQTARKRGCHEPTPDGSVHYGWPQAGNGQASGTL